MFHWVKGVVPAVAAASLWACAPADAALTWQAPEPLPGAPTSLNLSPEGVGLLFGFPAESKPGFLVRGVGGPLGGAQALPSGMGVETTPVVGWFADGSSLVADTSAPLVAFRAAGSAAPIGTPQNLGTGVRTVAVATAPSGEALLGLAGSEMEVAFRSAGPSGTVDMVNAQRLGKGQLVGVALDPAGGAVAVFIPEGTQTIEQAVREPGRSSFGAPTVIPSVSPYRLRMVSDPSGYAELAWRGGPPGTNGYGTQIVAAIRGPGAAFGAPQVIYTEALGEPVGPLPGITANGDGLVAWTSIRNLGGCSEAEGGTGNDSDVGAFVATSHGGGWSTSTLAGSTWPSTSAVDGVASAGNSVAVAYHTITDSDAKCKPSTDNSESVLVSTGTSEATGIHLEGGVEAAAGIPNGKGQFVNPTSAGLAVNPLGGVLYAYLAYPKYYLRARESVGAGGGGETPPPAPGPGGSPPPVHHILPIVPRSLVAVTPLSPLSPALLATCPPEVADECIFRVAAYAAFGAVPSRTGTTKAKLLGSGSITLRPGARGRVKLRFTAAGKRALSRGLRLKIRVRVEVTASGQRGSFTVTTYVAARSHKKH